jgi:hypothetical protein
MHFTVMLPLDGHMNHEALTLFPNSNRIEVMGKSNQDVEVRVTYCTASTKCPNDCQCENWELSQKAAESLLKAWPDQVDAIMQTIRRAMDHYCFTRWNMYVGVEYDGYIHT